jgi:hypothetical protein
VDSSASVFTSSLNGSWLATPSQLIFPLSPSEPWPSTHWLSLAITGSSWLSLPVKTKSKSHYDRRSVGQSILVSSPVLGRLNYCRFRQHSQSWFRVPSGPMPITLFFPRLLGVSKWGLLFKEKWYLTTTGHSPTNGGDLRGQSLTNWTFSPHTHTHTHTPLTNFYRLTAKLLLALASTVILGSEFHWPMTIFYSLTALGAFKLTLTTAYLVWLYSLGTDRIESTASINVSNFYGGRCLAAAVSFSYPVTILWSSYSSFQILSTNACLLTRN